MAENLPVVDNDPLSERAEEAFAAQQDKKMMKKLKIASDCIPVDKVADFLRAMGCNPSFAETDETVKMCDPDGQGVVRLPALMKPLKALLAKPQVTTEDIAAAFAVFDKEGKGLTIDEMRAILSNFGDQMSPEECDEYLALIEEKCCFGQTGKAKLVAADALSELVLPADDEA